MGRQVTPQILDALKKSCRPLYDDVLQEAYEYEIENLSHGALCDESIADEGEQKNLMHFLLGRQVEVYDDIIWTFENLEKIQAGIQDIKDGRLVTLMQYDKTGRARETSVVPSFGPCPNCVNTSTGDTSGMRSMFRPPWMRATRPGI